jgi:probable rRNA maturation factor
MSAIAEPLDRLIDTDVVVLGGDWSALGDENDLSALVGEVATATAADVAVRLPPCANVTVAFADDAHVAQLNGAFRGKSAPTNVLSFPAGARSETGYLGDVVLAAETVAAEANASGTLIGDHVRHLVLHGVLHLLGYDHESDAEAERILARLGVADPHTAPLDTDRR